MWCAYFLSLVTGMDAPVSPPPHISATLHVRFMRASRGASIRPLFLSPQTGKQKKTLQNQTSIGGAYLVRLTRSARAHGKAGNGWPSVVPHRPRNHDCREIDLRRSRGWGRSGWDGWGADRVGRKREFALSNTVGNKHAGVTHTEQLHFSRHEYTYIVTSQDRDTIKKGVVIKLISQKRSNIICICVNCELGYGWVQYIN